MKLNYLLKTGIHIALLCVMMVYAALINAQSITLSTSQRPTVCYNDGILVVEASGGVAPYRYTITNGPFAPNLFYPVVLPVGRDTFFDLTWGMYNVMVIDAANDTANFSEYVGGNYGFPTFTYNYLTKGIVCTPQYGLPPYRFAVSTTGSNTGFGAYHNSDTLLICADSCWVRMMDSCGNIYTKLVHMPNNLTVNIICENYSAGALKLQAGGGIPPYTYVIGAASSQNGIFNGISLPNNLDVYDSCGKHLYIYLPAAPSILLFKKCPFDSIYYLGSDLGDTLKYTCTNCSPVQSVTLPPYSRPPGDTLFRNMLPGHNYHIVVTRKTNGCGIDTMPYSVAPIGVIADVTYTTCVSIQLTTNPQVPVDSYAVYFSNGNLYASNHTGIFNNLPDSVGHAMIYTNDSSCGLLSPLNIQLTVPHIDTTSCFEFMRDSFCNSRLIVDFTRLGNESYFLTDTNGNIYTSFGHSKFPDITPGNTYTVHSSLGCTAPYTAPADGYIFTSAYASFDCNTPPRPLIYITLHSKRCMEGKYFLKLMHGQTVVFDTVIGYARSYILDSIYYTAFGAITVSDTGLYSYTISSWNDSTPAFNSFDTLCPITGGNCFVSQYLQPYPSANLTYECYAGPGDSILYHVIGGAIPYTIEIQGFPTVTIYDTVGIFPTYQQGNYTIIAYDKCGISRSLSFIIADTCNCNVVAHINPSIINRQFCTGQVIQLNSNSTGVIDSVEWLVNGVPYSSKSDTILIPGLQGYYRIDLLVYGYGHCFASQFTNISVDTMPNFQGFITDTAYCTPYFSRVLSTGIPNTIWSTGWVGNSITVTSPGIYSANINNGCGSFSQSINISVISPADLGADTTYCSALFSRILNTGFPSTTWSTGAVGSSIVVSTPGTYTADYSNQCGSFTDSIHISAILPHVLGADTAYCDTIFSRTLSTGFASTVWSTGATGASITVTSPGTYIATYSNACGSFADTTHIGIDLINGFNLTDSFSTLNICNGIADTVILHARVDSPSVSPVDFYWSNGQTDHQVYSSSAFINAEGNYTVIVQRGSCRTSGQSLVDASVCDSICFYATAIPDAFSPNGDHKNDDFKVLYSCPVYSFSMIISDRWGQTMYQSDDIDKGWDGSFNGMPQPQGTYLWFVCVKESPQRNAICRSGTLSLFR